MSQLPVGILDKTVKEILDNHEYLTSQNVIDLRKALPAEPEAMGAEGAFDLRKLLDDQQKMLTKAMNQLTIDGKNASTLDYQRVQGMASKQLKAIGDFMEQIKAHERHRHVENAIVEALNEEEFAPLKAVYMEKLAENLGKKA